MKKLESASFQEFKDGCTFTFAEVDLAQLERAVGSFWQERKYRLETGDALNGTWGIGSDIWRLFLGAFHRRYKFHVECEREARATTLTIKKGMSGAMGGVIGVHKMKKEVSAVIGDLYEQFAGGERDQAAS